MDFNNEYDRKWIFRIIFCVIVGAIAGNIIKKIEMVFLVDPIWRIVHELTIPACIFIGLAVVGIWYDRSKKSSKDNKEEE